MPCQSISPSRSTFKVGTLVTSGEDALRKGKEEDLKKVWIATELQWVVSGEEVVEFDKEEDSWSEVQDLVSSQFQSPVRDTMDLKSC